MANRSVADFMFFLNQQMEVQRQMEVHLSDLDTLLSVCLLTANFYELPKDNLHHYFSMVSDLIEKLKQVNLINIELIMKQIY